MKTLACVACALLLVTTATGRAFAAGATSCESLSSVTLPDTTITTAKPVTAGQFVPPNANPEEAGTGDAFRNLPAFCRVAATIKPTSDSDIRIEVWMPASGWNGKFEAVGNGGWAGSISYANMATALRRGYATSSTDTGHTGAGATFAIGHREKLIDYAYRAEHEMAVKAKAIIAAHYGNGPSLSYFNGCSTGGRQALTEAQRFPEDYNGIIAGASANPKTSLDAWRIFMAQAMFKDQASFIPKEKYATVHKAVLGACDSLDGLKDGLIEDPMRCKFDPAVLECKGADSADCLTSAQVATAKVIMSPVKDRQTGAEIFPGFAPGNELGWGQMLSGPTPYGNAYEDYKSIIFADNPNWDWRTFSLERDLAIAKKVTAGTIEGVDPNLSAFTARGGKLLMYHGWADHQVAPGASVNFYKSAMTSTKTTDKNQDWLRLFMVPGMMHCRGGEGPDSFDTVTALETWVEKSQAPTRIVASKLKAGVVERSRPLCAYPQVARYKGTGSVDDAANFECKAQ